MSREAMGGPPNLEVKQPVSPKPLGLFTRLKTVGGRTRTSLTGSGPIGAPQDIQEGGATCRRPSEIYRPSCGEEVRELVAVLDGYGVHVVYAGSENDSPNVLTLDDPGPQVGVPSSAWAEPLKVPEDTEIVLVLADAHFPHAAAKLVMQFKSYLHKAIPVIVVLLNPPSVAKDLSVLVCATGVLATTPADDIIVQPGAKDDLPAMLAVIMEKVERRNKLQVPQKSKLHHSDQCETDPGEGSLVSTCEPSSGSAISSARSPVSVKSVREIPVDLEIAQSSEQARKFEFAPSHEQAKKEVAKTTSPVFPERSPTARQSPAPVASANGDGDQTSPTPKSRAAPPGSGSGSGAAAPRSERRHGSQTSSMWDECKLLRRLRHPNVVSVQDVVDAQLSRSIPGATPANLKRTISQAGGRLRFDEAQALFWQISSGMAYCHEQRIAHRNLKPESFLVTPTAQVKVSNFSLAVKLDKFCKDKCGTMPFVAPEVLKGARYDASAADVWSMGVVLLEMLCGINKLPRMLGWGGPAAPSSERAKDLEAFFGEPAGFIATVEADMGGSVPDGLRALLIGVFTVDPASRWRAAHMKDSEWLAEGAAAGLAACFSQENEEGEEDTPDHSERDHSERDSGVGVLPYELGNPRSASTGDLNPAV